MNTFCTTDVKPLFLKNVFGQLIGTNLIRIDLHKDKVCYFFSDKKLKKEFALECDVYPYILSLRNYIRDVMFNDFRRGCNSVVTNIDVKLTEGDYESSYVEIAIDNEGESCSLFCDLRYIGDCFEMTDNKRGYCWKMTEGVINHYPIVIWR
jgi:hypothetical protein